ncbi:hypothetical protein G7Y89_g7856 [Cudoniella acicularis]|uniref:AAA+ ATPase domain-containing protein n=1 Tax=Cudoniella acicularis TaxID=354080 RepID=A0A8H4W1M8_9HELO|nr:hypothetical protein G7Y89_g7856 [Cudoniella acicularis]
MLQLAQDRPNFGNGGEVDNMIESAKAERQKRLLLGPPLDLSHTVALKPEDFDTNFNRMISRDKSCRELFRDVIGCEDIIQRFESYQLIVEGMRKHGADPRSQIPFTFVFKDPPGTGKTTTARKVGQIFYDMGFLSKPSVVECSVTDMVGEYTGQTRPKVINLLEMALGKVLFIDEAYRLGKGDLQKDATNELVDCITKTRYAGKMIIILAGYEEDMNQLIQVNRGLASRFPTEIIFRYMSPEHCLSLLKQRLGEFDILIKGLDNKIPSEMGSLMIYQLFADLAATPAWGNGRDVETLAKSLIGYGFMASVRNGPKDGVLSISFKELHAFMKSMLEERKKRGSKRRGFSRFQEFSQMKPSQSIKAPPPPTLDCSPAMEAEPVESKYKLDHGFHEV